MSQTLFSRGPSATARMVILIAASIALMTIDHRWHSLEMVRSTLSGILYPLQYTIDLPIRLYYWGDEVLTTHQTLLEKNRQYEQRHLENRVQLQKLDILERENDRLRRMLSAIPKTTERLLIAEVINVDVDPYRHLILLNKGSKHGVYRGQPIIDARGVMGQIAHVGMLSSTALLITDANHAIPVQINRTGTRAVADGTGKKDILNIRHLPHNVDIVEGDLLISSGLGGVFPPNFPVAIVSRVERPIGETFATIEATPQADLDKSREVLLVWTGNQEQPQPAAAEITGDADDATQAESAAQEKTPDDAGTRETEASSDTEVIGTEAGTGGNDE